MGDYKVSNNTLFQGAISSNGPPQFLSQKAPGTSRFMHREFVADVVGSTLFKIVSFPINPLNNGLFPWFSSIATNFEQYHIHGMVFEFKTTSATAVASTNTALGAVILATQYNPLDLPFVGKLQMEQYQFAVSTVPSCSAIHPVECKPEAGSVVNFYCFPGASGDIRFSNFGTFSIACVGMQAASIIGELWVSYDIELMKPRLFASVPTPPNSAFAAGFAVTVPSFAYTPGDMFAGVGWNPYSTNTIALTLGTNAASSANQIQFPGSVIGTYLIMVSYTLTQVGAGGPGVVWSVNTTPNSQVQLLNGTTSTVYTANRLTPSSGPAYSGPAWRTPTSTAGTYSGSGGVFLCDYQLVTLQGNGSGIQAVVVNAQFVTATPSGTGSIYYTDAQVLCIPYEI
jgi:hypothetical protein